MYCAAVFTIEHNAKKIDGYVKRIEDKTSQNLVNFRECKINMIKVQKCT